jgi:hypothetical protein
MFSSTDLIRKSKMIFDKINSREIDKAIILRDGKPNFMLLNFGLYEKVMAEYDALKKLYEEDTRINKQISEPTSTQVKKHIVTKEIILEDAEYVSIEVENNLSKFNKIINVKKEEDENIVAINEEQLIVEDNILNEEIVVQSIKESQIKVESDEDKEEKIKIKEFKAREEIELRKALEQLEALNLDPVLKEEVKEKIKIQNNAEIKDFWN